MRYKLADRLSQPGIRFRRMPWGSKVATVFLILIALAAIFAPLIAPYDPLATGSGMPAAPSAQHWFGTDRLNRDILSRMLYGARSSLLIGLGSVILALILGGIIGSLAATGRRWVNETTMRVMDVIMAFPGIALAAMLLSTLGNSIPVIIVAIAIIYTPQLARVVRANVLTQWNEDYVRAERIIGARRAFILVKHVVRNCAAPVLVFATVMVADAIIFEASLSFLGAGIQDPDPSWGNVISYGRNVVLAGAWWATTFAGITILLTVLALNVLSEGMTDAMANPKLRSNATSSEDRGEPTAESHPNTEALQMQHANSDIPTSNIQTVPPGARSLLGEQLAALSRAERSRSDRFMPDPEATPLLEVKNLSIAFPDRYGETEVVSNVSFTVAHGETMGLVGESGSGKSITSLAIMGLQAPNARVTGSILFNGRELVPSAPGSRALDQTFAGLRGEQIAMVYQDALSSLNPSMLIKDQMRQLTRRGGRTTPEELLRLVNLDPERTLASYPHELSGGQRQRVLIAMALSRSPKLVVADEPTTALDVTVQRQVVDLLLDLQKKLGFAMIFVSHDLALVGSLSHRVTVLYAGQVVEMGTTRDVLSDPRHEYTQGLLGAVLSIESSAERLYQIPGTVPSPTDFASGDRFAPRSQRPDADPNATLRLERVGDRDHYWATNAPTSGEAKVHIVQGVES
ncbi:MULTISPECIES: dipeptide/oligopeptide/nickel ABC transporter permease/ATP-binding protein [Micrococcales]|uniref:dipeptide/oligopeptide/nickel ABC transporter permease/ATP-binding protein n=1 Tax=Micrococcales TaxID=85006 RepID=UPI0004A9E5FC|nr:MULTISPECIES: dipeptide/oligopeptide/nickel ABC transporter permease/ATP-binding protein [Micrococcales]